MSVSIRVYDQGERIAEDIHEGTEAQPLFDLIDGSYSHLKLKDTACEEAKGLSAEKNQKYLCVDNGEMSGADAVTEYVVEFDAELHRQLTSLIK